MSANGRAFGEPTEAQQLRAEIEQTRTELGETVEALAAKADVKARAKESVEDAKIRAKESVAAASAKAKESVAGIAAKAKDSVTDASAKLRGGVGGAHEPTTVAGQEMTLAERRQTVPWVAVALATVIGVIAAVVVRRRRA